MNMSTIISSIITSENLYDVGLPFIDGVTKEPIPVESVVHKIIKNVTLPLYSEFCPWIRTHDANIRDLKVVNKKECLYKLPAYLTITPIKYVIDVRMPYYNTRGTYGDIAPAYGINRSVQGVITSQAYMMLAGQMRAEPTFNYKGNNIIQLYGWPSTFLTFEVACVHMENGESLEEGCYDSFLELATYDVQITLYNSMKRHKNIPSAHGNLNIDIDDWANAKESKKEWLERYRDTWHVDLPWEKWM